MFGEGCGPRVRLRRDITQERDDYTGKHQAQGASSARLSEINIWEVQSIMVKCPKCNFDNQEGALFCEQCHEDLAAVVGVIEAVVVDAGVAEGIAVAEAVVIAEPLVATPVAVESAPSPPPEAAPAPEPSTPAAEAPSAPPAQPAPPATSVPPGSKPKLVVIRGQKINAEYPIYGDLNFVGRADEKPVDIDLEDQEPPDRVWCSRQHAVINFEDGKLSVEDLNSANGTYVNRTRVYPGQKRPIGVGDVVQIGTVQLKVKV